MEVQLYALYLSISIVDMFITSILVEPFIVLVLTYQALLSIEIEVYIRREVEYQVHFILLYLNRFISVYLF